MGRKPAQASRFNDANTQVAELLVADCVFQSRLHQHSQRLRVIDMIAARGIPSLPVFSRAPLRHFPSHFSEIVRSRYMRAAP